MQRQELEERIEEEKINQTGNQGNVQDEDQENTQDEDQENVQDEDQENIQDVDQENIQDENRENYYLSSLSRWMNEKVKDLDNDYIKKLVLSSCINLTNVEDREIFSTIIPQSTYRSLVEERTKKNKNLMMP